MSVTREFIEVDHQLQLALEKQDDLVSHLKSLHSLLDCQMTNKNYLKILNTTCNEYLMYWWICTAILMGLCR